MARRVCRQCDIGAKTNSQRNQQFRRGYKLHLDVADGQPPSSVVLTSASGPGSQVAVPLMMPTPWRVVHLGTKKSSPSRKVFPDKLTPQLDWAEWERYKIRTMSERVNARLKAD